MTRKLLLLLLLHIFCAVFHKEMKTRRRPIGNDKVLSEILIGTLILLHFYLLLSASYSVCVDKQKRTTPNSFVT